MDMSSSSDNPLENIPAGMPPAGTAPNFVDPPSNSRAIVILDSVFISLMLLAVLIRAYVRVKLTKIWAWNDCESSRINSCGFRAGLISQAACVVAAVSASYDRD
jgi:hypothetical protein